MGSTKVMPNGQVMQTETIVGKNGEETTIESHYDMFLHVELAPDKPQIAADDIDTATITAKVFDYLNNPFAYDGEITFDIEGEVFAIQTADGSATVEVTSNYANVIDCRAWVPNSRGGGCIVIAK